MLRHVHDLKTGEVRQEVIPAEEAAARELERAAALLKVEEEQAYEGFGESLRAATDALDGIHYSQLTPTQVRDMLAWLLYERRLLDSDGNLHIAST